MKVAIHQPDYLPGLNGLGSFWPKAKAADLFILLDTVQFSPHSYRCRAPLPYGHTTHRNGHDAAGNPYHRKLPYLTIPCRRPHMVPIKDVLIDWRHYKLGKHVRNLENMPLIRERMQPFIDALRYGREMRDFENRNWNNSHRLHPNTYDRLADWNELLIKKLAQSFGVKCQWRRASQIEPQLAQDKYEFKAETRLRWILTKVGATTYLTGPMWRSYAPNLREVLKEHGIELEEVS
jgi:hypothetical protein